MEPVISLKNVSFTGQNVHIVRDITLDFEEGKTTALVGASGCGKSTLLKLAAGLLIPSTGEVLYRGRNIAYMSRHQNLDFRKDSAFVFQDSALWANQNLYQNLDLPLRVCFPGMPPDERLRLIKEVSAEVGYRRNLEIRPAALSMGEQKLIGFARAMITKPTVLFLDEWTESLDENSANRLLSLVKRCQLNHNTIIFVSHNLGVIRNFAQQIVFLAGGRVYMRLTAEQIRQDDDLARMLENGIA